MDGVGFRVIDMFAGVGGFSLGLHETGGFETIAFAETDPYASRVLAERFPGVPNVGDVQTAEYPDADFICAGFPCQDISFAGDGAGLAGARSGLWREVVRAIRVVRPAGALLENVAALLSRGMGTVLGDLAEVGHDAEWHCVPASAVGAPHRRDRVWIVANARDDGHGPEDRSGCDTGASGQACGAGDQWERFRHVSGRGRAPLSGWLETALADAENDRTGWREQLEESSEGAGHVADAARHRRSKGPPDARGCAAAERARRKNGRDLPTEAGGSLNPTWVEWLMGFPLGWTDCAASETPPSRKSSK